MSIEKSKSKKVREQTDSNRRSFLLKAGTAVSAGMAATVPGMTAAGNNDQVDQLSRQVARLQDENAIRKLHSAYENYLDSGRYSEVADLFTIDAEVIFNGDIYKGKEKGITQLYNVHFNANKTGKKLKSVVQVNEEQQDVINVSADGKTATAKFDYSIQVGEPMAEDSSLVQMARLQGEGIMKFREGGVYEIALEKNIEDGIWKIKKLEHKVLARTQYTG